MGLNKKENTSATVYETRSRHEVATARLIKIGHALCRLGVVIGLPAVIWGIHEMGKSGNPWIAIGAGVGTVLTEVVGARIIYSRT